MANITESAVFRPGIYQLATTDWGYGGAPALVGDDPVPGATPGLANAQAKQLADRTVWLKRSLDYAKGGASGLKGVVISAKQDSNGNADFLTLTSGSPDWTLAFDVDATDTLIISFSDGYDAFGPRTFYAYLTSISSLTLADNDEYLIYAELNTSTGAVTVNFDTVTDYWIGHNAPVSPVSGHYWFDLSTNKMKRYVSSAWADSVRVIIASASTNFSGSTAGFEYKTNLQSIYGNETVNAGAFVLMGANLARPGYLFCSGQEISRTQYKRLFDILGTTFGVGDGSTTFNIPDFSASTDTPNAYIRWFVKY